MRPRLLALFTESKVSIVARLSGRPLLATSRDRSLAVGVTAELARIADAVGQDLNVLISTRPGGGATTTLHRFARLAVRELGRHPRFVNAAGIDTADGLLHQLAGDLIPTVSVVGSDSAYSMFARYAGLPDSVIALVDNLSAQLASTLFGTYRDELWAVPVTWVVTCRDIDRAGFLRPPAESFFDVVVDLPPLDEVESARLLRRRTSKAELPAAALRAAVAAGGGNPRALINAARAIVLDGGDPASITQASLERVQVERSLSRSALMLLAQLRSLGPSSASDRQLQDQVGWTRARLVQVFAELEHSGAVDVDHLRDGRSGRPRKVYRARH